MNTQTVGKSMLKELFFKHLVFTNNNLKRVLLFLLINVVGVSTFLGIPIVIIFDIAFLYYNIDRLFKKQGGFRFLLKVSNFLWLLFFVFLMFFILKYIFEVVIYGRM